jgi:hypothetical protein
MTDEQRTAIWGAVVDKLHALEGSAWIPDIIAEAAVGLSPLAQTLLADHVQVKQKEQDEVTVALSQRQKDLDAAIAVLATLAAGKPL